MLTLKKDKKELYQWDTGVKLVVDLPCDEVHFSTVLFGESIIVLVKDNEVEIPNILLTKTDTFYCWAFVNENSGGYTITQKKFDIRQRPKPSDYVYTETEVKSIEGVVGNALKKAKDSGYFDGLPYVELPQEWVEINKAYEDFGEPGHKLLGGLTYKDFDGNIKVFPLSPAYGVRTDECGAKLASVAVYNSAQQLLVKPATDGRHTVSLQQLDKFFGGTDSDSEKTFSIKRVPPVDTSLPKNERDPYVFCRDSDNNFSGKKYSTLAKERTLVERDEYGRIYAKAPNESGATPSDYNLVNVSYFNQILNQKLSNYLQLSGDNAIVYGDVYCFGRVNCQEPKYAGDAVTLGYLNNGVVADITDLAERLDEFVSNADEALNIIQTTADNAQTTADEAKTRLNALADSDDITLDQLSEIVAYIKSNKSLIDSITTSKVSTSGGTMTGTLGIQNTNPALKFTDTTDNNIFYVQAYLGKLRLGYAWRSALAIDPNGNVEVNGTLSCNKSPTEDNHAVNLGYLNNVLPDIPLHYNYAVTLPHASIENMIKPDAEPYKNSFRTSDFSRTPKVGDVFSLIFTDGYGNKGYSFAEIVGAPNDDGFTPFEIKQTIMLHNYVEIDALKTAVETLKTEDWTFTLEDGSTVTKKVYLK